MLVNTFNSLATYIANAMDVIIKLFLACLDLDLSTFLGAFPAFGTTYSIFRMIGLGLALIIATVSLFRFFTAQDTSSMESPVIVLLRTAATAAMIYFGGYVLEYIVHLASFSYGIFLNLETAPEVPLSGLFDAAYLTQILNSTSAGEVIAPGLLAAVAVVLSLLLVVMIAINLFKLLIEVAERFMVVGVLVFTAPLSFSTFASQNSSNVFKNWCKMFLSSCVMMTVSVFFLKLVVSGLYAITSESYWLQFLLILALCKIAQRIDSYMAQLGLGTAITGNGTAADLLAGAAGIKSMFGHRNGGSRASVLGADREGRIRESRSTGIIGGAINSARSARLAFLQGKPLSEATREAGSGFINTMRHNPIGAAVKAMREAPKGEKAAAALKGAAAGTAATVAQAIAPELMSKHHANAAKLSNEKIEQNRAASADSSERAARSARQHMSEEAKQQVAEKLYGNNAKGLSAAEKNDNFAKYGIASEGKSAFGLNPDTHEMDLGPEAKAAGLSLNTVLDEHGRSAQIIDGGNAQMAALMSNEYGRGSSLPDAALPSDDFYNGCAINALKANPDFAADCDQLDTPSFDTKWGADIAAKASEFRAHDAECLKAASPDYTNTLLQTAENMSSTAAIGAFFDTTKTMQGDDALGNAMMQRAFPELTEVTGALREITAMDRAAVHALDTGSTSMLSLDGGRFIEAKYGESGVVHIYNDTAYTAMSNEQRRALVSYEAADGRQFWIDQSFGKSGFTADLERPSGRTRNQRTGSHVRPPKKQK